MKSITIGTLAMRRTGGVTTEYVGESYAPTSNVAIYFDENDIQRAHHTMGEIQAEAPEALSFEQMEQKLVQDAMAKGADAIVVGEMETIEVGSSTSSYGDSMSEPEYYLDQQGRLRKKGGDDNYHQYSSTMLQKDHILKAKLIKYDD